MVVSHHVTLHRLNTEQFFFVSYVNRRIKNLNNNFSDFEFSAQNKRVAASVSISIVKFWNFPKSKNFVNEKKITKSLKRNKNKIIIIVCDIEKNNTKQLQNKRLQFGDLIVNCDLIVIIFLRRFIYFIIFSSKNISFVRKQKDNNNKSVDKCNWLLIDLIW